MASGNDEVLNVSQLAGLSTHSVKGKCFLHHHMCHRPFQCDRCECAVVAILIYPANCLAITLYSTWVQPMRQHCLCQVFVWHCRRHCVSHGRSPGSYTFDCVLGHHIGQGAFAALSLCMVLRRLLNGRTRYDVDEYIKPGNLKMIGDAAKGVEAFGAGTCMDDSAQVVSRCR